MKQGWTIKKLRDISEYFNGLTYTPKDVSDDGVIVLRSSNIQNEKLDFSDIVRVNVKVKDKLFVNEGDILMCSRNGSKHLVGKTAPILDIKEHMTFGTFMMIIRSEYNPYLLWFLKTDDFKRQISGGENTMINQVTRYMLDEITLPFPPANEQERIVGILDIAFTKIEALRANAQQNLQNTKDLFQASIDKAYAIPTASKPIISVAKVINGYAFSSDDFKPTNAIKSIKITNVGVGEFIEESDNYLPAKYADSLQDVQVSSGDIVIALTRTIISAGLKVAIVPNSYNKALVNQRVAALVPFERVMSQKYLYNFLLTTKVKNYVLEHVNTLMQPNLSITDLKNMDVPYLPYEEQKVVANNIDALSERCRAMEENYRQTIAHCNALKQALLTKAFNGEL